MMLKAELCRYRYDALDQLIGREAAGKEALLRFYRHEHLTTELQGQASQSVFQHDRQLLALKSFKSGVFDSELLATDQQRSVLQVTGPGGLVRQVYTAYGHRRVESGPGSLLGFNGEAVDPVIGHYLLGNGHRAFNPVLMRFNCPDRLSPFGRGGLNTYAYCKGDPVNYSDPTGQFAVIARILTSIGSLFNSVITLRPSIPFPVALDALANGAVFRSPLRHTVGAVSAVTAGVTGVAGAAVGVASTVTAAINPTSALLAPMANTALGLTGASVAGRLGSWWAALDETVISGLQSLSGVSPAATGRVAAEGRGSSIVSTVIEMGDFAPSAPPLTPGPLTPSAPPLTPLDPPTAQRRKLVATRNLEVKRIRLS